MSSLARWRDDVAHIAGEGVAALNRGDHGSTDQAIEHLLVLDDERRRDTRTDPESDDEELAS